MRLPHIYTYPLAFLMFVIPGVSVAQADSAQDWSIVEISGSVAIKDAAGRNMANIQVGTRLVPLVSVTTGQDGHLVVTHGQDRMTVGADARFDIPLSISTDTNLLTRIKQSLGSILYQVEHRVNGGFEVETPYLVSVVKGTTFNILVTGDTTTVALIEGRLLVYTPDKKSQLMIEPGQAAIKSKTSDKIILMDQQSRSSPVTGPIRVVGEGGTDSRQRTKVDNSIGASLGYVAPAITTGAGFPGSTTAAELNVGEPTITPAAGLNGGTVSVSEAAISIGTPAVPGIDVGTASVGIGGASINAGATPAVNVGAVSVDVGATSIGGGVIPAIDVGATSVNLGATSVNIGAAPSINVGAVSVDVGATSIGGGVIPGVDVGATSANLGATSVNLGTTPGIDVGNTSVQTGAVSLGGVTAPAIDVNTSLNVGAGTGAAASLAVGIGNTPVVNVDVTNTNVDVGVHPGDVVTTVTNTVSNTTGTALNILKKLPGL